MSRKDGLCWHTNSRKIESIQECKAAMGQIRKFDSRVTWVGESSSKSRGCSISGGQGYYYGQGYKVYWNPTTEYISDKNSHAICSSECKLV